MKIISSNDDRYVVLGTVSVNKAEPQKLHLLKQLYTQRTPRNGDIYFICNKIIEANGKSKPKTHVGLSHFCCR